MSTKLTVLRGVLRVARPRFRADLVMSCNWRPERESEVREETSFEFRGVKKRVKRLGVMGGGRLGFREQTVADDAGGGDEKSSGVGSWMSMLREAHGDDMVLKNGKGNMLRMPVDSSGGHTRAIRQVRPGDGTNAQIHPARLERKAHDQCTSRRAGATDVHRYALLGVKWHDTRPAFHCDSHKQALSLCTRQPTAIAMRRIASD